MASTRAAEVAEVLWELKRADKLATFSAIAKRAGFSAGANGKTMNNCLKTVRRDWPHLQWWRAISDDGSIEPGGEQEERLREIGLPIEADGKEDTKVTLADEHLMDWAAKVSETIDTSSGE